MRSNNPKFTFITYCDLPNLDADDQLVAAELTKRGYLCNVADWRDQTVPWVNAGICVVRSTWDYHLHYQEFLSWIEKVAATTTLYNNVELLRWNSNKHYLLDLERASVPIVPTVFFQKEQPVNLGEVLDQHQWVKGVLKPAVGLSTFGVKKIARTDLDSQSHLNTMLKTSDVLLQPFIESVHDRGERALVFPGGDYSHTVRKSDFQPLAQAGEAGETIVAPEQSELKLADLILKQVKIPVAFARVDLIKDTDGQDLLMELELVEPSLYMGMHKAAVTSFADVLCKLATIDQRSRVQ
jgi:glutathione synthase/RimK-type ligase-like ATP-grasp enzyme